MTEIWPSGWNTEGKPLFDRNKSEIFRPCQTLSIRSEPEFQNFLRETANHKQEVKLIVVSDFDTAQKNLTELSMKLFVDALRQSGLPHPDQSPTDAQRYQTLKDFQEKRAPHVVDITNPVGANGFKGDDPEPQVLFFGVKAPPG
jgi:hypothetical protein